MSYIPITIGIVTFKERKEIVQKLIKDIRLHEGDDFDILLMINGNNEEEVDNDYRTDMLTFCSNIKKCYPFFFPEFKSLSKLWNNIVIFSKTEYNFIICDDVIYNNPNILKTVKKVIDETKLEMFKINNEFSHFVLTKNILHKIGYFDERLLSHGEEDADMIYRYQDYTKKGFANVNIAGIYNDARYDLKNKHSENHIHNKPIVNRKIAELMYKEDQNGMSIMGGALIKKQWENIQQYPYELFINKNKHNIKKFTTLDISYE